MHTRLNTRLSYLCRDASTCKVCSWVTFPGAITDEEQEQVIDHCDEGTYFLAEQVGLPHLRDDWSGLNEDDHIWHELERIDLTTGVPTTTEDIHIFVARFCATEWDEDLANSEMIAKKIEEEH